MRFPQTAALIAQEGTDIIEAILVHDEFKALLERQMEASFMASVQELKDALDSATSSFDSLVGKVGQSQGGIDPSDLDPVLAEVNDLKAKIDNVMASLPGKTGDGTASGGDPVAGNGTSGSASGVAGTLTN